MYFLHLGLQHLQTTTSHFQHNKQPFSTTDRDNDNWYDNCAAYYGGGWWYNGCFGVLLTGRYNGFYRWRGDTDKIYLLESVMMVRRRQWIMGYSTATFSYFETTNLLIGDEYCHWNITYYKSACWISVRLFFPNEYQYYFVLGFLMILILFLRF